MTTLDQYSDEELGRVFRAACRGREAKAREALRSRRAFDNFLTLIGLDQIRAAIELAGWAWGKIKSTFMGLFS